MRACAVIFFMLLAGPCLADGDCVPMAMALERMPSLATAKPLSHDQFWFMAGIFYALPDTPEAFPRGDRAVFSRDGGYPSVVFLDGEMACERMRLSEISAKALDDVAAKKLNHAGEDN